MAEVGHIFVARSDLRELACDAMLVPTDESLSVGATWGRVVGEVPPAPPDWPDEPLLLPAASADPGAGPRAWLVATAGLTAPDAAPDEVERALTVMLARVEAFVAAADTLLAGDSAREGRERPLLALPVVGTGPGGLRARPGAVVSRLLERLDAAVATREIDVVVVANSAEKEALVRHWRRKLWARRHGDPDAYGEAVLARWRRGQVEAGEVRVVPATRELRALRDQAHRGALVPFFGSGVTRASGAPSWLGLLDELAPPGATGVFADLSEHDRAQMADPFARAQVIANLDPGGSEDLRRRLRERLAIEHLSLLHVLLANLDARDAVTTNYDLGYERACATAGREVAIVPDRGGDRRLVKLHGSLDREGGEPLLTRDQLLEFQTSRGAIAGVLQMLLITGHLVFVGYSMSDPSLHAAFHAVRWALEGDVRLEAPILATSLQVDPGPALAALWNGTVDVLWPDAARYPTPAARIRQKEILLDLLADAASHGSLPLLAMDDLAAERDLTEEERELRDALVALEGRYRAGSPRSPLWAPVEDLLSWFHWGSGG